MTSASRRWTCVEAPTDRLLLKALGRVADDGPGRRGHASRPASACWPRPWSGRRPWWCPPASGASRRRASDAVARPRAAMACRRVWSSPRPGRTPRLPRRAGGVVRVRRAGVGHGPGAGGHRRRAGRAGSSAEGDRGLPQRLAPPPARRAAPDPGRSDAALDAARRCDRLASVRARGGGRAWRRGSKPASAGDGDRRRVGAVDVGRQLGRDAGGQQLGHEQPHRPGGDA